MTATATSEPSRPTADVVVLDPTVHGCHTVVLTILSTGGADHRADASSAD